MLRGWDECCGEMAGEVARGEEGDQEGKSLTVWSESQLRICHV